MRTLFGYILGAARGIYGFVFDRWGITFGLAACFFAVPAGAGFVLGALTLLHLITAFDNPFRSLINDDWALFDQIAIAWITLRGIMFIAAGVALPEFTATFFAAAILGSSLISAVVFIMNKINTYNSKKDKNVEHSPLASAIYYGMNTTNDYLGEKVYNINNEPKTYDGYTYGKMFNLYTYAPVNKHYGPDNDSKSVKFMKFARGAN